MFRTGVPSLAECQEAKIAILQDQFKRMVDVIERQGRLLDKLERIGIPVEGCGGYPDYHDLHDVVIALVQNTELRLKKQHGLTLEED